MNHYQELEVLEIRQETRDTKSFVLKSRGSAQLMYKPGQFLTLVLFFAAGSGITPVITLIKAPLFQHPGPKVRLVYSNHSSDSTIENLNEIFPSGSGSRTFSVMRKIFWKRG